MSGSAKSVTVHYSVTDEFARKITAQAAYNVTPPTVGAYFNKINCFCFTEQTLEPGEKRDMPVVFFVDPALAEDPERTPEDHHAVLHLLSGAHAGTPVAEGAIRVTGRI